MQIPGENTRRPTVVRLAKKGHGPISQPVTEARGMGLMFILWIGEEVFRMPHTHTCPVLHDLLSPSPPSQPGPQCPLCYSPRRRTGDTW